jgi:hypothetical protein
MPGPEITLGPDGACACLGGALSVATSGAPAAAPLTTLAALYAVTTRRNRFLSFGCCVQLRDRVQVVIFAYQAGIVSP